MCYSLRFLSGGNAGCDAAISTTTLESITNKVHLPVLQWLEHVWGQRVGAWLPQWRGGVLLGWGKGIHAALRLVLLLIDADLQETQS